MWLVENNVRHCPFNIKSYPVLNPTLVCVYISLINIYYFINLVMLALLFTSPIWQIRKQRQRKSTSLCHMADSGADKDSNQGSCPHSPTSFTLHGAAINRKSAFLAFLPSPWSFFTYAYKLTWSIPWISNDIDSDSVWWDFSNEHTSGRDRNQGQQSPERLSDFRGVSEPEGRKGKSGEF